MIYPTYSVFSELAFSWFYYRKSEQHIVWLLRAQIKDNFIDISFSPVVIHLCVKFIDMQK